MRRFLGLSFCILCLVSCMPVKTPPLNEYKLTSASIIRLANKPGRQTLLISKPIAAAGFDNEQMMYMKQPFQLSTFVKNAWLAPPAEMLQIVLMQSAQNTHYFHAVVTAPFVGDSDIRLDTKLVQLQQNFIERPSVLVMTIKAEVVDARHEKVIASRQFKAKISTHIDNPYGGVIAANKATKQIMSKMMRFLVNASRAIS